MGVLLTALTAAYNSESTLHEALSSAVRLNQIPVLLVDDGSTDGTVRIASSFGSKVEVVKQANAGPSVARNRGILESRTEFVMFLDSDDVLRPGFREAFEADLAKAPDADVFVCGMEVIDDDGSLVDRHPAASLRPSPYLSILRGEPVPTNGIIVRRSLFAKAGLFDPSMRHAEDMDLWLRIAAASDRWVRMDHQLAAYRLRGGSLSRDGDKMWRGIRQVLARAKKRRIGTAVARQLAAMAAYRQGAAYVYVTAYAKRIRDQVRSGKIGPWIRLIARNPAMAGPSFSDLFAAARRSGRKS